MISVSLFNISLLNSAVEPERTVFVLPKLGSFLAAQIETACLPAGRHSEF